MHADVIAGGQINQTLNKIMKNFMNKYVNSPCNCSLATSFNILTKNIEFAGKRERDGEDIPVCGRRSVADR